MLILNLTIHMLSQLFSDTLGYGERGDKMLKNYVYLMCTCVPKTDRYMVALVSTQLLTSMHSLLFPSLFMLKKDVCITSVHEELIEISQVQNF